MDRMNRTIKKWVAGLALALALGVIATRADGPLTSAPNLGVKTDSNGYLLATFGTYAAADGPLTAFGNIKLRTDSNGYLLITPGSTTGLISPVTIKDVSGTTSLTLGNGPGGARAVTMNFANSAGRDGVLQLCNLACGGFSRIILGTDDTAASGASLVLLSTGQLVERSGTGAVAPAGYGNITAQTSNATIATLTAPASDGDFNVSGQMSVTASTVLTTTLTVTYTDVANVARTMILPVQPLSGTFTAGGAITGAGASIWETPVMHIRVKASTAITILTSAGTFTGVTYSASGVIRQLS